MKLSKTKMLARVLSFGMLLQTALIPFASGMKVAFAAETSLSAITSEVSSLEEASFPLERSYCLQTEQIHVCTKYYDYYNVRGDLVSSGLADAKKKLEEQYAASKDETSEIQSTDRRVLTEKRGNATENTSSPTLLTDTSNEKKSDTTESDTKKADTTEKKEDTSDPGAQVNTTSGADEDKGVNSDPERKLACPRGYVLDKIYDACCPTTDGETPVGKYDPYTGKCGTAEKEETTTVFTCPRGYVVDEKYDKCCPTDDEGKAVGKYDPTTDKCGEAKAEEKKEEQTCDPGYELDATYKKCCPNNEEVKSKYDPFSDTCKQVSEEPVETMTCERGYVLDEKYDACCPTGDDGKALGKYDPNQKMCVPESTETEPTDPEPAITCPRGYILDEKYDACCPTDDEGKAVGKYNPETDKCGTVTPEDVVNTVTCGDGNYLVESVGKCCPMNSTYDTAKGICTNVADEEKKDSGSNNSLLTTGLGALAGMFLGKKGGKKPGSDDVDPDDGLSTNEIRALPFVYKVGISDGNNTDKAVHETNANGSIPASAIYDGQLIFKIDLGQNADKVEKIEYSFLVKQGNQEASGYERQPLQNNRWTKVVDLNELNAMLTQLARKSNSNSEVEYFVYVWLYPKTEKNQPARSPKPYQIRINIKSTINTLGEGEDCKSHKDKCQFEVTTGAGVVLAQYSDFLGTITKDAHYNPETQTCDVEVDKASGNLETATDRGVKESNDVVFNGKQVVLQIKGLDETACNQAKESGILTNGKKLSANRATVTDDSTGNSVYMRVDFADDALSVEKSGGGFDISHGSYQEALNGNESTLSGGIQDGIDGSRVEQFNINRGEDGRYVVKKDDLTKEQLYVAYTNAGLSSPDEVEEVEFRWEGRKLHAYVNGKELDGNEGVIQPDPDGMAGDVGWVSRDQSAGKVTQSVNGMQYKRTAVSEIVNAGVTTLSGMIKEGRNITMFGVKNEEENKENMDKNDKLNDKPLESPTKVLKAKSDQENKASAN